jgi:DNA-binding transcriptional regulator YbjK
MDLVIPIVLGNCAIAVVLLTLAIWTMRFRRQAVALAECCDRWEQDCARLLADAPTSLATNTKQIDRLYQLYQQQLRTLDRLRLLIFWVGSARSLLRWRKK